MRETFKEHMEKRQKAHEAAMTLERKGEEGFKMSVMIANLGKAYVEKRVWLYRSSYGKSATVEFFLRPGERAISDSINFILDRLDGFIEKFGWVLDTDRCRSYDTVHAFHWTKKINKDEKIDFTIRMDFSDACERIQVGTQPVYEYKCGGGE